MASFRASIFCSQWFAVRRSVCRPRASGPRLHIILEIEKQVVRWHDAAAEKVLAHPVVLALGLEQVSIFLVAEDMDEELCVQAASRDATFRSSSS